MLQRRIAGSSVSDSFAMNRRLTVILAADAVGYSRLMSGDEAATLASLNDSRSVFLERVQTHQGRVIDTAGDSVLAEFPSPIEAVSASVEIQQELARRNAALPEARRMMFRIGINLGDVIESKGAIYGDGVNVAARLQALADPGGICISGTVFDQVEGKMPLSFKSLGEQTVKNIPKPVRTYRLAGSYSTPPVPRRKRSLGRSGAAVIAVLVAAWIAWWQATSWDNARGSSGTTGGQPRLAILPLDSISPNAEDEYLANGMTEELISRMSRIEGLDVIARTSVMQYKGAGKNIATVGKELKVGAVLEGSIRKSGSKIRMTVQLIDVETQGHLWSQDYDRELKDVLATQSEIAEQVTRALHVRLLRPGHFATVGASVDPETYTLYLKGLHQSGFFTPEGLKKSIVYFKQAIDRSPNDARSWSGLAKAYLLLGWWAYAPPTEAFPNAKSAAEKALAIDGNLAQAHITLGMARFLFDWDWLAAEKSLLTAVELSPGSSDARLFHGIWLKAMGRNQQAVVEIVRANELDPLNLMASAELGWVAYYGGRLDEAAQGCRRTLEVDTRYLFALSCLQMALAMTKDPEAIAVSKTMVDVTAGDAYFLGQLGWAYGLMGQRADALKILAGLKEKSATTEIPSGAFLYVYMGLGDRDTALAYMEKAYRERSADLVWIRNAPEFAWLRADPRFQSLLAKMRFPE